MIRIEDLTVDLAEFILKDVNLEIKRGEYFVVLGPTGSGKSVLLETIAGLYQAKKMGITSIHITHERSEAIALADRIAVMNAGQILQVGTPESVFRKPYSESVANFVGVENLFKGKSVKDTDTGIAYIDVNGILIVSTSCKSGDVFMNSVPQPLLLSSQLKSRGGQLRYLPYRR